MPAYLPSIQVIQQTDNISLPHYLTSADPSTLVDHLSSFNQRHVATDSGKRSLRRVPQTKMQEGTEASVANQSEGEYVSGVSLCLSVIMTN